MRQCCFILDAVIRWFIFRFSVRKDAVTGCGPNFFWEKKARHQSYIMEVFVDWLAAWLACATIGNKFKRNKVIFLNVPFSQ